MARLATGRSSLAFFLGPNSAKTLVMVRNYGAIQAVLLTDEVEDASTVMRIPMKISAEFLLPYCDDLVSPELSEYLDKIQLYLSTNRMTLLGPLSSARAAYAMQQFQVSEAQAIELANQQAQTLLQQNAQRIKEVSDLMAAEHKRANGFAAPPTRNL